MMKTLCLMMLVIFCAGMAQAEDLAPSGQIGNLMAKNDLSTYRQLQEYTNFNLTANSFDDFPLPSDIFNYSYRSPGRAFFYSLLIPGGGQVYTGSKTKAAFFIGVEAALWVGYFSFHSDGQKKQDQYIDYANAHWSPELYTNWLIEELGITDDSSTYYDANGQPHEFSHHLPDVKNQQYYEMVGKYDQFLYGWKDTDYRSGDLTSDWRSSYLLMRNSSNNAFGKAKAAAIFSIANHLLSAFEAAWSAKRFNKKQDTFSQWKLNAGFAQYYDEQIPRVTLSYKFF